MKLSNRTERMITIALVAILVEIFFYQVAYGHTSAYWYGYKNGKGQGLGGIFDIGDSCDGIVTDNGRTINLTADRILNVVLVDGSHRFLQKIFSITFKLNSL